MQRLARKDEVFGFDRRNEYFLHEVDHILNLMKTNAITSDDDKPKSQSIEIMLCQAFNSLMRLRLENPFESIDSFLIRVNEMFPNGLFHEETDIVLTGLYSSVGIKQRLRRGKFQYDSRTNVTQGHFITAKLDLRTSKVTFIDSLNQDITKSSYFDFPLLARLFTDVYECIMTLKKKKPIALQFDQQMMKRQMASDCGLHLLVNSELWLRNFRPENQYFRDEDIKRIRHYHYLLCEQKVKTFKLDLIDSSS